MRISKEFQSLMAQFAHLPEEDRPTLVTGVGHRPEPRHHNAVTASARDLHPGETYVTVDGRQTTIRAGGSHI